MKSRLILIISVLLLCLFYFSCNVEMLSPHGRSEKLRAIKKYEITRNTGGGVLYHYLHSKDPQVRIKAIQALGRVGNPDAIPYLVGQLADENDEIMKNIAFALGLIGDKSAEEDLIRLLDRQPEIAISAIQSLGMLKSQKALIKFYDLMTKSDPVIMEAIAYAMAVINHKESAQELRKYAALRNDNARAAILYALYKLEDEGSFDIFLSAMDDKYIWVRYYGAKGLSVLKRKEALPALYKNIHYPEWVVALASLEALGNIKETDVALLESMLNLKNIHLKCKTAEILAQFNTATSKAYLKKMLKDKSYMVRNFALNSLSRIDPLETLHYAKKKINHTSRLVRMGIATALGNLTSEESFSLLNKLLTDRDIRVREASLESLGNFTTDKAKAIFVNCIEDNDLAIRAICAENLAKFKDASYYDKYVTAFAASEKDGDLEGQQTILKAMTELNKEKAKSMLEEKLSSPDLSIRLLSASLLKEHYNLDMHAKVYEQISEDMVKSIEFYNGDYTGSPLIYFVTNKGNFVIRLYGDEAPFHTSNMVALAKTGFYAHLIFHRVVPGFVVQGGDPRGDGWGTGGYKMPDEINPHMYERGSVGMPLAGKDTGGCQFFITLSPQPRLNFKYTLFGEVQEGMSVVDSLEIGDSIFKTIVIE